jgi:hypothetical protein
VDDVQLKMKMKERVSVTRLGQVCLAVVALTSLATLSQCTVPGPSFIGTYEYVVKSDRITLAWDPPASASSGPLAPIGYRVYYRPRAGGWWSEAAYVQLSEGTSVTIRHEDVGDGTWEFGVETVTSMGVSELHASSDDDADPFGGWYVRWKRMNE